VTVRNRYDRGDARPSQPLSNRRNDESNNKNMPSDEIVKCNNTVIFSLPGITLHRKKNQIKEKGLKMLCCLGLICLGSRLSHRS